MSTQMQPIRDNSGKVAEYHQPGKERIVFVRRNKKYEAIREGDRTVTGSVVEPNYHISEAQARRAKARLIEREEQKAADNAVIHGGESFRETSETEEDADPSGDPRTFAGPGVIFSSLDNPELEAEAWRQVFLRRCREIRTIDGFFVQTLEIMRRVPEYAHLPGHLLRMTKYALSPMMEKVGFVIIDQTGVFQAGDLDNEGLSIRGDSHYMAHLHISNRQLEELAMVPEDIQNSFAGVLDLSQKLGTSIYLSITKIIPSRDCVRDGLLYYPTQAGPLVQALDGFKERTGIDPDAPLFNFTHSAVRLFSQLDEAILWHMSNYAPEFRETQEDMSQILLGVSSHVVDIKNKTAVTMEQALIACPSAFMTIDEPEPMKPPQGLLPPGFGGLGLG